MSVSLRAVGVAAALLAAGATPAAAQLVAPPTLGSTDLITPPPEGDAGGAVFAAARCSRSSGFTAYSGTGTAVNGAYVGPFAEQAAAQLGAGGLSEDFEPRHLRTAAHFFTIQSPQGAVYGTQRALDAADGAVCVKPYFDAAKLYLSYAADTTYAARIETPGGVFVDRGEGSVSVDVVEQLDGTRTGHTLTGFGFPDADVTQLLRRRDCRHGGFAELAYASKRECRMAARANPTG